MIVLRWFTRLLSTLRALLAPVRCAGCGSAGAPWCADCADVTARGRRPRPLEGYRHVVTGGDYAGPLRRAVHALKTDSPGIASDLGRALWSGRLPVDVDAVTWIPAGPKRRERGYDQGRALARAAAAMLGVPAVPLLGRRGAARQVGLGVDARFANAQRGISLTGRPAGRRVLIVDDVVTTGASLVAAANCLRAGGALSIDAAVLAVARLRHDPKTRAPPRGFGA